AAVDAAESAFDGRGVSNVPLDQVGPSRQVLGATGREIIEHPNCVSLVEQRFYEMRTDEPGTASHQKVSHSEPLSSCESSTLQRLTEYGRIFGPFCACCHARNTAQRAGFLAAHATPLKKLTQRTPVKRRISIISSRRSDKRQEHIFTKYEIMQLH